MLERVRPLLETEGSLIRLVGPAGAGAATKLANQLMMLSALAGAHEALELAAAHGVSEESVLDVVASCTGESWVSRNWDFFDRTSAAYDAGGQAAQGPPVEQGPVRGRSGAARAADVRVPVAALLSQVLSDRVDAHAARTTDGQGCAWRVGGKCGRWGRTGGPPRRDGARAPGRRVLRRRRE